MNAYLFLDGRYLQTYYSNHMRAFYGVVPELRFDLLAHQLGAYRSYYYDAINHHQVESETVAERDARVATVQALHDHISSQPGFHVREGHVRKSSQKRKQEQKGVDVQLAVDALEHAARGNMQRAILFTGDLDFEPLLASLVRMGVHTKLVYVPGHASAELRQAADEIQKVTLEHFFSWAAPSFQANHKQVVLRYREDAPTPPIYQAAKEGLWNERKVTLFKPSNFSPGRLYVEWGDELSEPSYTLEHWETDDLPKAFEITFGRIEWK